MLLENIHFRFVMGARKFTAYGERGFSVALDFNLPGDRQYVIKVIETAQKQLRAKMYYGKLSGFQLQDFHDYLTNYEEREKAFKA